MLSRKFLVAVLLISYISTIQTASDDETSKWVQQSLNNATEEEELDLTPTGEKTNDLDCKTDSNEPGTCVVYYLCDPDTQTIISDGTTLIDIRQRQCISYLDVCCGSKSVINEDSLIMPDKQKDMDIIKNKEEHQPTPATTSTSTISDDKMDTFHSTGDQCGWDVPSLFTFPKNDSGIYANYGEFPWAVALIGKTEKNYIGGGTLIHPSVVLTVAHKVDKINAKEIKIRAGEWDPQTIKEKHKYQEKNVKKILIHPQFFKTSLYFDVALLILESPVDLAASPHIKPACLGSSLPPPGTKCFSMGWGAGFEKEDEFAAILKKVQLPLVEANDCSERLQQSRLGRYFRIHSSLTCAGGVEGVDTCQGDGGSALVCPMETKNKSTRYVTYGLVAYGIDCGVVNRPGVYANVPAALEWINQAMIKENYGTASYTM